MPFIGRRQALAALGLAPLAPGILRAAEPKRLIGVIEEDPPFFNLAMSSGILCALTLCGRPRRTTSMPFAASPAGISSNFRSVCPSRFGWTVESGSPMKSTVGARAVTWTATRGGGLTVSVKYRRGWVIYSARLALR